MLHISPETILPRQYNPSIFFRMHRQSRLSVLYKEKKKLFHILQVFLLHRLDFHSSVRNFSERVLHRDRDFHSAVPPWKNLSGRFPESYLSLKEKQPLCEKSPEISLPLLFLYRFPKVCLLRVHISLSAIRPIYFLLYSQSSITCPS